MPLLLHSHGSAQQSEEDDVPASDAVGDRQALIIQLAHFLHSD